MHNGIIVFLYDYLYITNMTLIRIWSLF